MGKSVDDCFPLKAIFPALLLDSFSVCFPFLLDSQESATSQYVPAAAPGQGITQGC